MERGRGAALRPFPVIYTAQQDNLCYSNKGYYYPVIILFATPKKCQENAGELIK